MKPVKAIVLAAALTVSSTPSAANDAAIHVSLTVPLRCDVRVLNAAIGEGVVVIDLERSCNSRHQVIISSNPTPDTGRVMVRTQDGVRPLTGGTAVFSQPEQYASQVEHYAFDMPDASSESVRAFATTIAVRVEAR